MKDQAESLRHLMAQGLGHSQQEHKDTVQGFPSTRVITVTSGKGGVGKSNFTLNFAIALQEAGYRTLIFDADIGMANIDVLIGSPARVNLYHVISGQMGLDEIVQTGPKGIHYIPGGSGFHNLLDLPKESFEHFLKVLEGWTERYDVILFDTGAGISKESLHFVTAAEETFVVTTPEPTAIADAYALIKVVHNASPDTKFRLVVNRATDAREGEQTAERITSVAQRFLQLEIPVLGYLPDDPLVMQAVKKQVPFTELYPNSKVSVQMQKIARHYVHQEHAYCSFEEGKRGVRTFLRSWLKSWR